MRFPFADRPDTAAIVCRHVLAGKPVLYVSHDAEDGMWQFLCGKAHAADDGRVISLQEAHALDRAIGRIANLPCGCYAQRRSRFARWVVTKP